MNVRNRIVAIRLAEKLSKNSEYTNHLRIQLIFRETDEKKVEQDSIRNTEEETNYG